MSGELKTSTVTANHAREGERPTINDVLEPGNGSRYELLLVRDVYAGGGEHRDVLVWLNGGGKSVVLEAEGWLDAGYLAEKLRMQPNGDVAAILGWLKRNNGCRVELPTGFDEWGRYLPVKRGGVAS